MNMLEGLKGRFDLIVANPPFVFLPEALSKTRGDSFGGHFGIELTLRIMECLEDYLSDKGKAIILSKAPIVDGKDLLFEGAIHTFRDAGWRVSYNEISHSPTPLSYREFYRSRSISRFVMTVLVIDRDDDCSVLLTRHKWFLGSFRYQF